MSSQDPSAGGPDTNPWSHPPPPEDFYRLTSTEQNHDQSTSPTDSQAPIMSSWTSPNGDPNQFVTANSMERYEPPLPMPTSYRSSIGVVNGEVGGTASIQPVAQYATYPIAPLSAGLKTSGTTSEEQKVAELEEKAQQEDRRDLAVKLKVRLAKIVLRSINCACSLVVLALVASTFAIFNATRFLPPRNGFRPWSATTPTWPQITILVIACISLALSLFIMYGYWRGGHAKAERVALHATIFAGAVFIFTIAMWSAGIGIMQGSRGGNDDQDLWGWACKDNVRRKLFEDSVNYTLVCRQQDWVVLCAIIEISVEFLAICVYLFAFYRLFHTKRKLRKSLNLRDEARSSLWLAKLREQKDAEESDHETSTNTAYNQLNSNTAFIDAEEGRAVPILMPAPLGHNAKHSGATDAVLKAPVMPAAGLTKQDVPPTPRSVSFMAPPTSSGSR